MHEEDINTGHNQFLLPSPKASHTSTINETKHVPSNTTHSPSPRSFINLHPTHHRLTAETATVSSGAATVTDNRKSPHARRNRSTPTSFAPIPVPTLRSYNVVTTGNRSDRCGLVPRGRGTVPQNPRRRVREQAQVGSGPIHVRPRERGVCGVRRALARREEGVHHAPAERVEGGGVRASEKEGGWGDGGAVEGSSGGA